MKTQTRIIMVVGPTGIGKTAFALYLAKHLDAEIIGGDSVQVYRYMDIGSAKPTAEEQKAVPHHMIDILDPDADFDAAIFTERADQAIDRIRQKGKIPIVAGGTGFYLKALEKGLFRSDPPDQKHREKFRKIAREKGTPYLFKILSEKDPASASRIHPNDLYRIIRCLETQEKEEIPMSALQKQHGFSEKRYHALKIGLNMERKSLYRRIDERVDMMISQGFVEEVKGLLEKGYAPELRSMQAIGYRHICAYLTGNLEWIEAVRTLKRDTRRFAKRQMTWFSKDPEIHWLGPEEKEKGLDLAFSLLS